MKTIIGIFLLSFFGTYQGFGQCVNSVLFNDLNKSANLPQTNAYYNGQNGFTWECWFRLAQPLGGGQPRPLIAVTDAVVFEDIWLGFGWNGGYFNQPTTKLVFLVYGPNSMAPGDPNCSYEPAGGFQLGVWYHVAATMDYNLHVASLYVDGVQVVSQPANVPPNPRIIPASLGCPIVANNQLVLHANMDEVRIWNKVLTDQEIYAGYKHCLSGTESGLELYYHCNDVGQILMDATVNQHNATFPGGGLWSVDSAPLADQTCMALCSSCPVLDAGPDVTTCGGAVQLSATAGWPIYSWSPSAGMADPSLGDQVVSPAVTTTYTVQASTLGSNLVVNGDFSMGNAGFTNGYTYSSIYTPCNCHVGPLFFNLQDPATVDHTPTSDNMLLAIDGCSGGETLWEQTFVVEPNANYLFGFWAARAAQVQPIFQTVVTGDVTGSQVMLTETGIPGVSGWVWDQYGNLYWNVGSNHTITITIKNLETDGWGNDFALDDFSLQKQCTVFSEVTVYVGGQPVDLGPDTHICQNTSLLLNAGNGYQSYLWSDGSAASTLVVSGPGTYWVVANDSCGGTHSDTIQVSLNIPPALDLGGDIQICPGDTAQLNASAGFVSYQWTGSGLSCYTCASTESSPLSSATYTVVATSQAGCTVIDSVDVIIVPFPVFDLGNDVQVCAGDSVYLSSSAALDNYQWSPGSTMTCSDCSGPAASPVVSTTYLLTSVNSLGCAFTDSIRVNVFPLPPLGLASELSICKGEEATLGFIPPALYTFFHWSPSAGLSCADCPDPQISPSASVQYVLSATTSAGCTAVDTIDVIVKEDAPTDVFATVTDATCSEGGTVVFEAVGNETGDLQYNFNFQGFSPNAVYKQVVPGNYLVVARNGEDGCPFNAVVVVGGEYGSVFIPNAFTPDGNEFNNTWSVQGNCITEFSCQIYDRWGENVAQLDALSQSWDGTSEGRMLPDGLYTYIIVVTYASYEKERVTGFIALLR